MKNFLSGPACTGGWLSRAFIAFRGGCFWVKSSNGLSVKCLSGFREFLSTKLWCFISHQFLPKPSQQSFSLSDHALTSRLSEKRACLGLQLQSRKE